MLATQSHHLRRDRHPRPSDNPHPPAATLAPVRPHKTKYARRPRGRSRNVSPVAIARQASEERRRLPDQRRHTDAVASTGTATRPHAPIVPGRVLNIEKQEGTSRLPAFPRPAPPKARSQPRAPPPPPSLKARPAPVPTQPLPHVPARPFPPPSDASTSSSLTSTSPESESTSLPTSSADTCHDPLPPPARTLRDEIQDAYALADMRRARALYLQLHSGVPVALTDPLIEGVSEEELCRVFSVPEGLFAECTTATSTEGETEVRRRLASERARAVWAGTRARVRAEKEAVVRVRAKRDEEAREHGRKVREVECIECEELALRGRYGGFPYDRVVNSFGARPQSRACTLPSSPAPQPFACALPKGSGPARRVAGLASSAPPESVVPFDEVLVHMRGALFPIEVGAEEHCGVPRSERVLLGLCVDTEDTAACTAKRPPREGAVCKACEEAVLPFPFPDPPPPTPASPWLAFLLFSSPAFQPPTLVDLLTPPPLCLPTVQSRLRHTCGRPPRACSFVAVDVDASPLGLGDAHTSPAFPTSPNSQFVLVEQETAPTETQRRSPQLARVLRLAHTVHSMYIAAMLAPARTAPAPPPSPNPVATPSQHGVRPADVRAFCAAVPVPAPAHPYILAPLRDLLPPSTSTPTASPRLTPTALFPVLTRAREVPNPAHLRLMAHVHVCAARGVAWEGPARGAAMGAGREHVVGVAEVEPGGSGLRWGWRVVWEGEGEE